MDMHVRANAGRPEEFSLLVCLCAEVAAGNSLPWTDGSVRAEGWVGAYSLATELPVILSHSPRHRQKLHDAEDDRQSFFIPLQKKKSLTVSLTKKNNSEQKRREGA